MAQTRNVASSHAHDPRQTGPRGLRCRSVAGVGVGGNGNGPVRGPAEVDAVRIREPLHGDAPQDADEHHSLDGRVDVLPNASVPLAAQELWTTSVCAGSVYLGATGVLSGLRATGHWGTKDMLEGFGATFVPDERYVREGKIITAAGVSVGIDMALYLVGEIAGARQAQVQQLMTEYDPRPPFDAGSLAKADKEVVEMARAQMMETVGEVS